jgi:hypothetical protein
MACNTVTVVQRGSSIVKIGGITPRQITLSRDTIAEINSNRPRVVPLARPTNVEVPQRPTDVTVNGGMGVQGQRGEPGSSIPVITFAWGDAPRTVWTPAAPGVLTLVRLDILTRFNGDSPTIIVGTLADSSAAMPANENDPTTVAKYSRNADLRLTAGQGVVLTITPGAGASAGDGLLILEFLPD